MNITKGKIAKAQRVVAYGVEGIGKSSFAARFPEPLFTDTEGSTNNMDVARFDKPSSWTMMYQQIDYIKQNRPCKTFIIDTIDWAERMAIEDVCNKGKKDSITDFGYGNGFVKLEEEWGRFLNRLQDVVDVGIHVVLIAHAKIVKFEQPDEMGGYDRWELKLGNKTTAKTAAMTKEWADMVLFMNYKTFSVAVDDKGKKHKGQGGVRTIYATHHPAWDAKNRHGLPDEFPLDYSYIAHIFDVQAQQQQQPQVQQPPVQQPIQQPVVEPVHHEYQQVPLSEAPASTSDDRPTTNLDPSIPKSLRDLMTQNNVSEEEIQVVVSQKGYYPMDTPIVNYDKSFIEGVLVGAWQQVFGMIQEFRKSLPFS